MRLLGALIIFFSLDTLAQPVGLPQANFSTSELKLARVGEKLFHDPRLSKSQTVSCATCHQAKFSFTSNTQFAAGHDGKLTARNVPPIINKYYDDKIQFWDGRANSLQAQIRDVLRSEIEMGNDAASEASLVEKLNQDGEYKTLFKDALGNSRKIEMVDIVEALVAFERTIFAGNSAYDRYMGGDKSALSSDQVKGKNLFFEKFNCHTCHAPPTFTSGSLRPRCYPSELSLNEIAEYDESESFHRLFKVPTLRNLSKTAPYLHNGAAQELEDVLDFYQNTGPIPVKYREHVAIPTYKFSTEDKKFLRSFLKALDGEVVIIKEN